MEDRGLFLRSLVCAGYALGSLLIKANCPVSERRAGREGIMDKVGDLLIRIKNGYMASRKEVAVTYSKLGLAICQFLQREGFISGYEVSGRSINVVLKYNGNKPALADVTRISKPSRRVYKGNKFLPRVYDGLGVAIISTPRGIMSDKQARKEKVGGEVMAYVW